MPSIEHDTRLRVIEELLSGSSYSEVAESVGISKSTVSQIAGEVQAGEYDEIDGAGRRWDTLKAIAKTLDKENIGLSEAAVGATIVVQLAELGVDITASHEAIRELTSLVERFDSEDLTPDEFVTVARRLHELEAEHDLTYEELVDAYQQKREELDTLQADIRTAEEAQAEAEAARERALEEADTTEADVEAYRDFRDVAAEHGLSGDEAMDEVLSLVGTYDRDDIDVIAGLHDDLDTIGYGPADTRDAIARCIDITEVGFDLEEAEAVAHYVAGRDEGFEASLERIVELLDRNETLDTRNHNLEQRNKALTESIESLESRVDSKGSEYTDVQSKIASAKETVSQLETRISGLRADLEDRRTEKQRLEQYIDRRGIEAVAVREFLTFLSTRDVSVELAEALRRLPQTPSQKGSWFELERSNDKRKIRDWLVEAFHSHTHDEDVITVSEHREQLEALEADHKATITDLEDEISALKRTLADKDAELDRRGGQIEFLETRIDELQTDLEELRDARETELSLADLENELADREAERAALHSFLRFIQQRELDEELLGKVLEIKRGEAPYAMFTDKKEDEARDVLVSAFNDMILEDDEVVTRKDAEQEKLTLQHQLGGKYEQMITDREEIINEQKQRIEFLEEKVLGRLDEGM